MVDPMRLARCVCSHPKAIHIGGGVCVRCQCGRFVQCASGYTRIETQQWTEWLADDEHAPARSRKVWGAEVARR